ncbi:MAG TPA: glutathione S-transferase family protein [Verrucomicrobiae bacterium]|nr:glutathione S-transferase family protein [Verrucomicrobiae bacterium]
MDRYRVFVSDSSYYSGKLEACLRYKAIQHERVEINVDVMRKQILPATGFMKVPAMQCPDGRWLKDTTPMIQWLDQQHPRFPVYPEDAATRFIALLVEDYADEWLWRPAMYYRWRFADSHRFRRARLGRELAEGTAHPSFLLGWYFRWRQYRVFVRGDGVRRHNEAQVEALYLRTLRELSVLLESRPFLLGGRPSIVDFAFFASMFRHFALDPHPAKIMVDTAPAVWAWVARVWDARGEREGARGLEDFSAPGWDAIFGGIANEYLPYLDRNAAHYAAGDTRFDLVCHSRESGNPGAVVYPAMPVVRYRVACRSQLLKAYRALAPAERERAQRRLGPSGIAAWLACAEDVDAGLDAEFKLPLAQRYPEARGLYGLRLFSSGTPWDLPAAPIRKEPR